MYLQTASKPALIQRRHFFKWLNIMFNKVDEDRRREVGPDRACAEWLLRNGGFVKFMGAEEYLTDYNMLPLEGMRRHIMEVDATDSSISDIGFDHFIGCNHIRTIKLVRCYDIEDPALGMLKPLQKSLIDLQVSSCLNITDTGLLHLKELTNLQHLFLSDLPYVKDKSNVLNVLRTHLHSCNIKYE